MSIQSNDVRCGEEDVLRTALYEAGIELPNKKIESLYRHLELVIQKNRTTNLTRINGVEDGSYLHVVDSLLLLSAFEAAPKGAFVDVGTGAGYPGIPLAIVTERKGLLVDSVKKKAAAVGEFVRALGLGDRVEVSSARAEELGRTHRGCYAIVTARAVAQTNVLVEYATPLLRKDGRLVVAKARPGDDEIQAAERAARVCGLKLVSRETFELPGDRGHREVLSYQKVGNPSIRLPRATGMAQHHPLGME